MSSGIKDFVDAVKTENEEPTKVYEAIVSGVDDEGIVWVNIAGSDKETPTASTSTEVKTGDIVNVEWRNNKLYIAGNYSNPSAGVVRVVQVEKTATSAEETATEAKETADAVDDKASSALTQAAQALSIAGDSNQYFWNTKTGSDTGAHITEVPQDEFTDPTSPNYQSGGNLLARSNGIAVRDGLTELAVFGADGISLRARQSFGTDSPAITSLMHIVPAGILASINGQSYFDINNPASGTQTIVYTGDGTTKRFRVYPVRNSVFYKRTVTIDDVDVPSTDYSISATQNIYDDYQIEKYYIVFNTAPVEGAEIRISYVPDDSACNFTLGERESETVSGEYSVSIGRWNRATEKGSLAFGLRNNALGTLSSAIGDDNEVKGTNSHVIGHGLRASRAGVFVVGKYNVDETSYIDIDPSLDNTSQNLFVVGKGSSDSNRSNALTVDRDGNVEAAGDITDGTGNVLSNKADSAGLFKIVELQITNTAQISAHGYQAGATYTVPAASRPSGMVLAGIVGYSASNFRLVPSTHYVNGNHTIFANMANMSATAVSAGATITFRLLYMRATSA